MSVLKGSEAPNGFVVFPLPLQKSRLLANPAALAVPATNFGEKKPDPAVFNISKSDSSGYLKTGGSVGDAKSNKASGPVLLNQNHQIDDSKPKLDDFNLKEGNCTPKPSSCKPDYDPCDSKPSFAPKIIIDETAGIQAGSKEISFGPPPLATLIPSGAALFSVSGVVAAEVSNVATAGAFNSVLSLPKAASSVTLKIKDNDGSANGIYSGLRAVNGSKIFFYPENGSADTSDFIFVGRVGNGSNPNPAGEVAVVLVYGALKNGAGNVTGFNLFSLLFDVPIEHPNSNNPNDGVSIASLIDVTGTYAGGGKSDSDCDDKGGKVKNFTLKNECIPVCILDDGPKISLALSGAPLDQLIVDETNLAIDDTKAFAAAFSAGAFSYGTDGPGSISSSYSLSIGAGSTGLVDVATGRAVVLSVSTGVVQGRTSGAGAAGGLLVFTLSVATNGDVTLDQKRALRHPDPTNSDDIISLSNANLIKLIRSDIITDGDGDTACAKASLSIGTSLHFKDDGPSAILLITNEPLASLVVDETNLVANATASFALNFNTASSSYGADGPGSTSPGGYELGTVGGASGLIDVASDHAVILSLNGTVIEGRTDDSDAFLVFTVSVNLAGDVALDQIRAVKHLDPTDSNDSVSLAAANLVSLSKIATVVDRDGDTAIAKASIDIAKSFVFKDDGPTAASPNQEVRLGTAVLDESPTTAGQDGIYLATTNLSAAFSGPFAGSYGADGPGTTSYGLTLLPGIPGVAVGSGLFLLDPLLADGKGPQIFLIAELDGSITGKSGPANIFSISVDAVGVVTFAYVDGVEPDNIWHPLNPNNDDSQALNTGTSGSLLLTQKIIDRDGDSAVSSGLNIGIGNVFKIEDDGPKALADANLEIRFERAVLDESPLPLAGDGLYSTTVALGGAFGAIGLADFGTDGPGTSGFVLNLTPSAADVAVGSGLFILDPLEPNGKGAEIVLVKQADGSVTGEVGLNQVFRISVDGSGVVTFAYVDGVEPDNIWHPSNPNNDDVQLLNTGISGLLSLGQRVVDADGDWVETANGFNLGAGNVFGIEDDGPKALADPISDGSFEFVPVFLDESPLPLDGGDGVYSISLALAAAFTDPLAVDYGTDGPGSTDFILKLTPSVVGAPIYSGLYLLDPTDIEIINDPIGQGEQIRLLDIAGTVYGVAGIADTKLFSISVDNLGVVTFQYSDQVDPANIWHSDVLNDDESELLNTGLSGTLSVLQQVLDADGDWVQTANGFVIGAGNAFGIQDDGPTLDVTAGPILPSPLVVDESFLNEPATFDFSNLVNEFSIVGTDKPGFDILTTYALSAVSPLQTNLIATAELTPVFLFLEGGDVVGRAGFGLDSPNSLGSLIFKLSLDTTTGVASLTQYLAVVHPIPGNPNEPINTQIGDDQITITVTSTIADSDGDSLSKSISFKIGDSLTFRDDAPSIAPALAFVSLASVVSSLSVDETFLSINSTTDFSGDFSTIAILPGNDGLKSQSIAYSLEIDPDISDSGLKDSATGDSVLLSKSTGGEVFGTINSGSTVVFKLTVDSVGKVTLDQQRSLFHPDALDPNDPVSLTPLLDGKQLISLVKSTVTIDKDDDPLTDTISLDLTAALEFLDDGPTAKNDTDALVSGSNGPESGNVITGAGTTSGALGADLSGADAPATISALSGAGGTDSTPGDGLSIAGSYGSLNIDSAGNYTYSRTPGSQDNVNDVFAYTLMDSDGDLSSASLTISIPTGPSFIVGSPAGDINGSSDPWTVTGDGNGVINGSASSDILIGDPGGSSLAPGSTANIVFVLDNSGSMVTTIPFGGSTKTRMRALQDAVIASLDTLYSSGAANIRVHIDKFSQSAAPVGTFNLTTNSIDSPTELASAKAAVNSITTDATTNYEAGLQAALNWIVLSQASGGPLTSATLSQLLFISDGEPNFLLNADNISLLLSNTSSATTTAAIDSALGLYNPPGTSNDDRVSEVDNIESSTPPLLPTHVAFTIEAIGINISSGALTNLTRIEGSGIAPYPINPDPGADNISTAEDLTSVIGDLVGGSSISDAAGNDLISGGDSIDLIFGDSLNSDQLAIDKSISATYPPWSGWDVFAFLEGPGGATKGLGGAQWTRTDSVNYIKANPDLVAKESGRSGGNDTIDGGNGDDVIYGQEGFDSITGAAGADRLSGGTGSDIFKYGSLASIATQTGLTVASADIITDFASGSDKIQTGIAGVVGANLRNDPGAAGRTFASSLVAANAFFNTVGNQAYNYFYTFDTSAAQTDAYLFFKSGGSLGNCIAGLSLDIKPGTSLQNGDII